MIGYETDLTPTRFQAQAQEKLKKGNSLLLVAPTGLGKTFAVTADIRDAPRKTVYSVPLRALGHDIRKEISALKRDEKPIRAVIHHGDVQESVLFSEEVVVTTYDQVVCGVPGLPLSLPLKAGHAVAGALLMSRLILDEVHLAWGISEQALSILLAIIDFRRRLGLQTVVLTATLQKEVAQQIAERLSLELMVVGSDDTTDDEGLQLRESNRKVEVSTLELKTTQKTGGKKQLDYKPLDDRLKLCTSKCIYFANTVERLQETYDRLIAGGIDPDRIIVLHNRMPRNWRTEAEEKVHQCFGKGSPNGSWILLTNQVAEAGLNISAPQVISDPAPVDTLVQRAGRCARWFRKGETKGEFVVITAPKAEMEERKHGLELPYRPDFVRAAIKSLPNGLLSWAVEQEWINKAWGGDPKKAKKSVERSLNETTFALNLFDRAAQQHSPGEIASIFREIVSVEAAVYGPSLDHNWQNMLDEGQRPETSSISLGRAWSLLREARGKAKVIRYEEGETKIKPADYVQTGDVVIVPSTIAYLHRVKGLCFGDSSQDNGAILSSEWRPISKREQTYPQKRGRQTLLEHTKGVMRGTYERLGSDGAYRRALAKIIQTLEPQKDSEEVVNAIAQIATLVAGFHDLGKADWKWQVRAREIDPECPVGLIGRTAKRAEHIGLPHTPPGYLACLRACELIGFPPSVNYLIRAIALASARHHSSLLNPATVNYEFDPSPMASDFITSVLQEVNVSTEAKERAKEILEAGKQKPANVVVPLLLPNDDLFPIYALVGRAILMADREDAAGRELEQWRVTL
ncbi:MAG: CRISPR-associated helicase Cas3' [Chloroflexi bacterium]|nr:CRISPR-associated helicase Cas3' [Chloroflexota bacterium]